MKFFVLCLACVATLTFFAIRMVEARNEGVELGFRIAEAARALDALKEEERQLKIDRAALLAPTRLAHDARKHGLRAPGPDEIVIVRAEGPN